MSSVRVEFDGGPLDGPHPVPFDGGDLPTVVVVEDDDGNLSAYVLAVEERTASYCYHYDGAADAREAERCPRVYA